MGDERAPKASPIRAHTVHAGASDAGRRREHNEDAYAADDERGVYVVADGVGGYARGEVASREAVDVITGWLRARESDIEALEARRVAGDDDARWELRRILESAVQSACYRIFGIGELEPDHSGMSTTVSAALVRENIVYAAHVGDSRIYRVRGGQVLQITEDHTLINYKLKHGLIGPEEAARARQKNVITRAVGHRDYVQIDTADVDAAPGDKLLLCTDGLHQYLRDDDEAGALLAGHSLQESADAAVELANARGGSDNITALVVGVEATGTESTAEEGG